MLHVGMILGERVGMILGERAVTCTCRHDSGGKSCYMYDSDSGGKSMLHVGMILGERAVTCRHDSGGKICYM